ncbi:NAD-dependent epimerase/dehydratase family protein [Solibacillus sp. R5-41]|uniref:NAD-dependent epimerase/dehydratase family protein n=1 Tax=Solibacillus sp. R5-41 TaxID=2048654 RepID=UPI00156259F7|nr:NAD-dependent epimerase/dehydratase family protein [Solibacillus sp. R5-41]
MKVLITGGYGFIGSHVADRFYKEGYEVHIIDNLVTGKAENIPFKHKFYHLSIDDPKCRDVFADYDFDIVVHLAAQASVATSMHNPTYDAQSNVVGLVQMLKFATEYKVKKFIFASSAAVYGEQSQLPITEDMNTDPISPYGISKLLGEKYCSNWAASQGLSSICFRFSNVYGPRQTHEGEGGVVSIFLNNLLTNNKLTIHGDGNQTRDFIYVEDVAFAIYRASQSTLTGIYNLSTNTEASVIDLIHHYESFHGAIETAQVASREGDIQRSILNNTRIIQDLDWVPMYSLEEGLQKTYEWGTFLKPSEQVVVKEKKVVPNWYKILKPYLENAVLFFILSAFVLSVDIPIFSVFEVGIFYIITVGAIYGNKQAFFAVCLSISLLLIDYFRQGREIVSLLYDTTFFFQISIFLFIGLVVGYSVQRKNIKITEQQEKLNDLQTRYDFLEMIHEELRDVKDELQLRVLNNEDSFGKIYSITKELNEVEPEKIFTRTIEVVQKTMRCENVSIYLLNVDKTYLRLVASSNLLDGKPHMSSLKVADTNYIQQIISTNAIFANRNLLSNVPVMAAPIFHDNKIKAVLMIDNLPFSSFSNYHENLFKVIAGLIETSLSRAFEYIQFTEESRYIGQSIILQPDVFQEILSSKILAKEKYNMPFTLLKIQVDASVSQQVAEKANQLLRETDYISYFEDTLYILLSNTTQEDIPFILKRFNNVGIETEVHDGVLL